MSILEHSPKDPLVPQTQLLWARNTKFGPLAELTFAGKSAVIDLNQNCPEVQLLAGHDRCRIEALLHVGQEFPLPAGEGRE